MQTKSNIQLIREAFAQKENFINTIDKLMDSYLVKDSVFSQPYKEEIKGYLAVVDEYSSLTAASAGMAPDMAIRVINNEKFQVGYVHESLSDIHNAKEIYDIAAGVTI